MTERINLKQELSEFENAPREEINRLLMAIAQMQNASEVFMAEIEDLLNGMNKFHYSIKREHKKIVSLIQNQFASIYKILNAQEASDFCADNLKLQDLMRAFVGLDKTHKVFLHAREEVANNYTMTVNPVGDIFLRNAEGWTITIPRAIAETQAITRPQYEAAKATPAGVPVALEMFIHGDDDEEE